MSKLRLTGDTSGYIEIQAPDAAGSNTLVLPTSNGSANQFLRNGSTAGTLQYSSMVEDSSSNVGIGTASVEANTNYSTLEITGKSGAGGGIIRLKTTDRTTAKTMLFCDTGGFEARVETNHPFVISTNNTERLRVLAGGGLTFNGDTAAANALDDYEEGSWTPEIAFGGDVVGQSYSGRVGRYTKIGRVVMFHCRLSFNNKGSSTGQATLRTLPFIPESTPSSNSGANLAYVNAGNVNFGAASRYVVDTGSTSIVLRYANGGGSTDMTQNDFNNSTDIIIYGQYATG